MTPRSRRVRGLAVVLAAAAVATGLVVQAQSAPTPAPGFTDHVVLAGLTQPTVVRFSPDGRIFVAEKSGIIKVFSGFGDPTPTVFADLRTKVYNFWDRGLLGLQLHPNFPHTPYVYVLYTYDAPIGGTAPTWGSAGVSSDPCPTPPGPNTDGCIVSGRLSRLEIVPDGDVSTGTETVFIEDWCQQFPSHSIGDLEWGPDGMLYVSGGDGASFGFVDWGQTGSPVNPCGDSPSPVGTALTPPLSEGGALRSQDVRTTGDPLTLDGSILRLDPNTGLGAPGNPFSSSPDPNYRRVIASGLRNPFRMAFEPGTDRLFVGDVGFGQWEEINKIESASNGSFTNFGWPCYEGPNKLGGYDDPDFDLCEGLYAENSATMPFLTYSHGDHVVDDEACPTGGSSTAGLEFEPSGASHYPPRYEGALFFLDNSRKCIWAMHRGEDGDLNPDDLSVFVSDAGDPVDIEFGPDGYLYYVDFGGGRIHRMVWDEESSEGLFEKARGHQTTASSIERIGLDAEDANDGDLGTRWASANRDDEWWQVDLGAAHPISRVNIKWEDAYASHYEILTSVDGANFTVADDVHIDAADWVESVFEERIARFVRVRGITRATIFGTSFYELEVWGDGPPTPLDDVEPPPDLPPTTTGDGPPPTSTPPPEQPPPDRTVDFAATRPATASSVEADWLGPAFAVDGDPGTRWASAYRDGEWWQVDLGSERLISEVRLNWEAAYASRFRVLTSTDGTNFTVATEKTNSAPGWQDIGFTARSARYVRILTVTRATPWGSSFFEAQVFGPASEVQATIVTPTSTTNWSVGTQVSFSGTASSHTDGALPPSAMRWSLVMHHCPSNCHTHPIEDFEGVSQGTFHAPDHEYPSYLELRLSVTDSTGATATTSVDLQPSTVALDVRSEPAGARISVNGVEGTTPFTRTVIAGSIVSVSAASPQPINGATANFVSWSDGGALSHLLTASTNTVLTATFNQPNPPVNVALGKKASASSVEWAGAGAAAAVDGNLGTRWSSAYADNQWWQVDLASEYLVSQVRLNWEAAYARRFQVLTSLDGTTFDVATELDGTGVGWQNVPIPPRSARYVRVLALTRATGYGSSFFEAEVYGNPLTPPPPEPDMSVDYALGREATSSSNEAPFFNAPMAVDGNSGTRWSSSYADGEWWQVDLGSDRNISRVRLNWEGAYAAVYQILTSTDGTNFTVAADAEATGPGWQNVDFTARAARYVRVLAVTRATGWGSSFWDAQVYGPPVP